MGDDRNRLAGLERAMSMSKEAMYVRLRCPVLPLLEPMASEKRGAFRGELMSPLVG